MAVSAEKKKIMCGMDVKQAKRKLLEIFDKAHPGLDFEKVYPKVWPWLETWFRLRARNETFDIIAQAFAEKVSQLHKQVQKATETIHLQRLELGKRLREIEQLKLQISRVSTPTEGRDPVTASRGDAT